MIKDYIKERSFTCPDVIFVTINNMPITYKEFDDYIYCIELFIKSLESKPQRVKIKCSDKKDILASIIACNRTNCVPVVFPPDNKMIKFIDYNKIVACDFEVNDNICIIQSDDCDKREEISYKKNDIQCILFTSGTEMNPKAVELTFDNIYNSALNWQEIANFKSDDVYLNVLPIWHISGLSIFFRSLYFNFQSIVLEYNKNEIHSIITKLKISCISAVPKMIVDIMQRSNNNIFKSFKIVIIGGDGINEKVFDYFKNNDVNAYISYGMTETSSGVCGYFIRDVKKFNHGFLGFAHKNTRMTVNDGCIKIQSNTVMEGYVNSQKCNGIFLTEDLGVVKNNQLFYKSRSLNFIISGGENINLKVIKNVISGFEKGIDFEVKAAADDKWGHVIAVLIKKSEFNIHQIKQHCQKYLPEYMVPKHFINHIDKQEFEKIDNDFNN